MNYVYKVRGDVLDDIDEVECRFAFLTTASLAISERNISDIGVKTWTGLYYFTADLKDRLAAISNMVKEDNPALKDLT